MVKVFPHFDLSEAIGAKMVELEARDVDEVIRRGNERYGPRFSADLKKVAIVVNGRNIHYQQGMKTKLADGDEVWFVVPSSGG